MMQGDSMGNDWDKEISILWKKHGEKIMEMLKEKRVSTPWTPNGLSEIFKEAVVTRTRTGPKIAMASFDLIKNTMIGKKIVDVQYSETESLCMDEPLVLVLDDGTQIGIFDPEGYGGWPACMAIKKPTE